jgi:hypothetical protein
MELTITQNGALYLAAHRLSKNYRAFFREYRFTGDKQSPDVRRRSNSAETLAAQKFNPDNGR